MANVRTQNLQDFTVQIRDAGDSIIGTGVAVTMDGKIVTCRHVVEDAIGSREIEGAEVNVRFPLARGGEKKDRKAVVEKFFQQNDEDIVLLQLKDGASPLAPEQMPKLGDARESAGNQFKSFGYRRLSNYQGLPAKGEIIDYAAKPEGRNLLCDPLMLESQHIDSGMSGAAVLDVERNLVVGIIAETYESASRQKDRDTSFAVDNQVLTFSPFDFRLEAEPYPLKPAPEPKFDIAQAEAAVFIKEKYSWNAAPAVLPEWTGRDDLLAGITADWNDPSKHVTGLIGFGGEGKSSLARKWVDQVSSSKFQVSGGANLTPDTSTPDTPEGIFWWGFYENRSVDEFLEAALNFLSGGRIDPRQVPSSSLRAQIIGAMLGAGRYLFVLDGLEVLQHQEGDQYGLLQSNDLRDLLTYFARPDNQSFCLITSRAPVLDLMDYTTYTHRDVDRLSDADGVALLEKLGVKGSKDKKQSVISDWNGHALTLSLIGSYLVKVHKGDIARVTDFEIEDDEDVQSSAPDQYKHVGRILRRYDEHLTEAERAFMILFSAFRTPVRETAFDKVFRSSTKATELNKPLIALSDRDFKELHKRLETYRILHSDPIDKSYTTHPLIRNHYFAFLTRGNLERGTVNDAHLNIKDYYLSIAGDTPQYPTLEDLKPLIEVVHHACQAGAYDEANKVRRERIYQEDRKVIIHQLGAYETTLNLFLEFFPDRDTSQDPLVNDSSGKRMIINSIGFCLTSLGRLREAVPFYERAAKSYIGGQDWSNASVTYQNLADLHAHLGALEASVEAARQALDLARKAEDKQNICDSMLFQAWATHLFGDVKSASAIYIEAESLQREIQPLLSYHYSSDGVKHADHLRRMGDLDYARRVTEANLELHEKNHIVTQKSQCYRILGDLDFDSGNPESARAHYESALKIARSISYRPALIEALLARGRFYAKTSVGVGSPDPVHGENNIGQGDPAPTVTDAFNDLNEALNYAVEGGYRIYEADIRVALAWAWLGVRSQESGIRAKAEAERALQMSEEMKYHWGKVDAREVLGRIGNRE